MAKRFRFYSWSIDDSHFGKLRQRLNQDHYSEESGQGFHLLKSTRQEIDGRFVQRVSYLEEVVSPDGSRLEVDRISYIHTSFKLRPAACGLLLIDPPRSASAFLYRLSYLMDYELSVQPAALSLAKLKRSLQRQLGRARVTSVKITGASLAENAVADISVTDPQDALEKALELFPEHRKCVGKLDMAFGSDARALRVSAARTGAISTNDGQEGTVDALWEAVAAACS